MLQAILQSTLQSNHGTPKFYLIILNTNKDVKQNDPIKWFNCSPLTF